MTRRVEGAALASIRAARGRTVVVLGDVILDQWVRGSTTRLSPEASVPVIEVTGETEGLGGAANVAHQLAAWGAEVLLVGLVGDDAEAERVFGLCSSAGISTDGIVVDDQRPTTRKVRVVDDGAPVVRLDREATAPPIPPLGAELLRRVQLAGSPEAVVISDYGKGVVEPAVCRHVVGEARVSGVPTLVDPQRGPWDRYRGADTVKANRYEYESACSALGCDEARGGPFLRRALDLHRVVVTDGAAGFRYWDDDGRERRTDPDHADVVDVTGAGDTVLASLTASMLGGLRTSPAVDIAAFLARMAVESPGVKIITEREVRRTLDGPVADPPADLALAGRVVDARRSQGDTVVLANGCFDLLHPGHLHLLDQATRMGDYLIVAINGDASVARLKGPHRPVETLESRVRAVAGVPGVDLVVTFDDDTPIDVINRLRPDVLVKGSDHAPESVVGADEIRSWGGDVRIVPRLPGFSTSALASSGN